VKLAWPAAAVLLFCSVVPHPSRMAAPRLFLWAWERPEDLRFIDSSSTGVAYLAATASIQSDGSVRFRFRQQPLLAPPSAVRIAVVRIEAPARYVFPEVRRISDGLLAVLNQRDVRGLQVDFDARLSKRRFYKALLEDLRARTSLPIGITALASWCEDDRWIDPAIVSEAVPMFFRMGPRESKDRTIRAGTCKGAAGVSTDEEWPATLNGRVYVFNPHSWTAADYAAVRKRLEALR
jgi:hypothetical protein